MIRDEVRRLEHGLSPSVRSSTRATRHLRSSLAWILSMSGCSPQVGRGAHASAPGGPTGSNRWEIVVAPDISHRGRVVSVEREPGGEVQNVLDGSQRLRVTSRSTVWSQDFPVSPLVGAAHVDGAWLFVSADGAVYSAPSFVGALGRAGDTGGIRVDRVFRSRGILAFAGVDGSLWVWQRGGVRPITPRPGDRIMDAGFVGFDFGVVISDEGFVLRTVDACSTFQLLGIRMRGVSTVEVDDTAIVVRSPSQTVRVERASTSELPEQQSVEYRDWIDELPQARTPEDAWREFLAELPVSGVSLADGTVTVIRPQRPAGLMVRYDPSGTLAVLPLPGRCPRAARAPYGRQLLLTCSRSQGSSVEQFVLGADGHWLSVRSLSGRSEDLFAPPIVSTTGPSMVFRGACEPTAGTRAGGRPICWFDGNRWATRWLRRDDEPWPVALVGNCLAHFARTASVNVVDLETQGSDVPVDGEPIEIAAGLTLESVTAIDGSHVFGVAAAADGGARRILYYGAIGTRLTAHPLPDGALDAAFADATHAIAAGDTFGQVWVSEDGANSWTRVSYAVGGSVETVSLASSGRESRMPWVECSPSYCRAGDRVMWLPGNLARRLRSSSRAIGGVRAPSEGSGR